MANVVWGCGNQSGLKGRLGGSRQVGSPQMWYFYNWTPASPYCISETGKFELDQPDRPITRQDLVVILSLALHHLPPPVTVTATSWRETAKALLVYSVSPQSLAVMRGELFGQSPRHIWRLH